MTYKILYKLFKNLGINLLALQIYFTKASWEDQKIRTQLRQL